MYDIKHETKGLVSHGVSTCAGCGLELVMRNVMEALGDDVIVLIPPGCAALFSGFGAESNLKVPGYQGNLENTAAGASGVRAALDAMGNHHTTVLAFAGDGATVDIGLQSMSGAFERGDRILYICYDNEAYMNTGNQASSSTPLWASTTTTPAGKCTGRKDLGQIAIAHNIPYMATASIHNLSDLKSKVKKAQATDGPSLIHVFAPCPTGWRSEPAKTVEIARMAEKTGCWVLYEYENGKITINSKVQELAPVSEYLSLQSRFKHIHTAEQLEQIQEYVTKSHQKAIKRLEILSN